MSKVAINSPINLIRKLGWKEGINEGVRYLLGRTDVFFHYPNSRRGFEVNFDMEWKYMEKMQSSESETIEYLVRNNVVKSDEIILDAGASVGYYTLLFSDLVGEQGRIIAFEPDPVNNRTLLMNLERNKITNVKVEPICLSDSRERLLLSAEHLGTTESSVVRYHSEDNSLQHVWVESITIDEYCKENAILPTGVKIDVEGAEALVFRGMKGLIQTCKPWVLMELHSEFLGSESVLEIWKYIQTHSKRIIFLGGDSIEYAIGEELTGAIPPKLRFRCLITF